MSDCTLTAPTFHLECSSSGRLELGGSWLQLGPAAGNGDERLGQGSAHGAPSSPSYTPSRDLTHLHAAAHVSDWWMRGQVGVGDGCDDSFTVKRRRARQRPLRLCMLYGLGAHRAQAGGHTTRDATHGLTGYTQLRRMAAGVCV